MHTDNIRKFLCDTFSSKIVYDNGLNAIDKMITYNNNITYMSGETDVLTGKDIVNMFKGVDSSKMIEEFNINQCHKIIPEKYNILFNPSSSHKNKKCRI